MEKIILICVKEKNKLRIKFESYTNPEGKVYYNVYNNMYNCRFPRALRAEGRRFEIPKSALTLSVLGSTPFYNINKSCIKILDNIDLEVPEKVYTCEECIACMDTEPNIVCLPCAHASMCKECYASLPNKRCPICRCGITGVVDYTE